MRSAVRITMACCVGMLLLPSAWATILDFNALSGQPVPDNYGGLNWVDPYLGNLWTVDPNCLPENDTPCAVFYTGDMRVESTVFCPIPVDFISVDFAGASGDVVKVYGEAPGWLYYSGEITLDGVSMAHYEEQWLDVTSFTFSFDSLYPGSTYIDNLTFTLSSERRLATIFKQDFESVNSDQDLLDSGWKMEHGQYPASDGGIWHLADTPPGAGVNGKCVISDSDAEGELPPGQSIDERLISPEIDCTEFTDVRLEFRQDLVVYVGEYPEVFNIHISSDPQYQTWVSPVPVPFRNETDGSCSYRQSVNISELADGKKIKIRWRYTARFDYWWAIDEVRVIGRPNVLKVTDTHVNVAEGQVSIAWDAPDGFFTIEASDSPLFSEVTELATGITQKQWTGADPRVSDNQRYYRVRMD